MSDGSYVTAGDYSSYTGSATPVGIVCHVNNDGTTGLMLGLTNSYETETSIQWAPSGTTGYNTNFTTIQGLDTYGDIDGSDNWAEICASDPEGSANPAENYPVFNYALTYAQTANLTETNYKNGWYVPTIHELYHYVWLNMDTLNNSLNEVGGTQVCKTAYWSSSQHYDVNYVMYIYLYSGRDDCGDKSCLAFVCCLRAF